MGWNPLPEIRDVIRRHKNVYGSPGRGTGDTTPYERTINDRGRAMQIDLIQTYLDLGVMSKQAKTRAMETLKQLRGSD
jgi:hypothetical protein